MESSKPLNIINLFSKLWGFRKRLLIFSCIGLVIGLLLAFTSPKEWSSYALLIPESNRNSASLGSFGGLAGLAGVEIPGSDDGITVELYGDIVLSTPIMAKLLNSEFYFASIDQKIDLHTYLGEHIETSLMGSVVKFLQNIISIKDSGTSSAGQAVLTDTVISLTYSQEMAIKELRERVGVDVDKKTSVVTIACRFQDPVVSAQITAKIIDYLSEFLSNYYRDRAYRKVVFIQNQVREKDEDFRNKQEILANFRDSNKNLSTDFALRELRNLESEVDLAFNLLSTLQTQFEEARIEYEENAPFLNILEPPRVPYKRASPKRKLILIASTALFLFLGCAWVFVRNHREFIEE